MSGDVQPRKRKDKKKKKDDLGAEEPRGTAATLGEGDVFMHSYHDHGTGGHWCAKIIFFSLLTVLVTLIGLIILENRGLTELEANSVESRYSGVLEGWIEDAADDHHDEHTLELKHHDDDEDHPGDQLGENEAEEESLEEEIDRNNNDDESNEDEIEEDDETQNDDEEEDELQNEDRIENDDDEDQDDDDEEGVTNDDDENQDEDNEDIGDRKYEDESKESLREDEDEEEETYEKYSYEEITKPNNGIDENDDEDEEGDDGEEEEQNHDYLSKEMTSHYNYHESYENGDHESKETKYNENESNELDTEDEENEHDQGEDEDEDEQEIEKIEKEIFDDSEEVADAPASGENRATSKEDAEEEDSKEDDEPVEKLSRPRAGKPLIEIEEEIPVKPVDTLAEEEAYEREQEELRRQEEQAPHSVWLKLCVGGLLLAATHALVRRATRADAPETDEPVAEETPSLTDRRMTLIDEPVVTKSSLSRAPRQNIDEEVFKKPAPVAQSAPITKPQIEEEIAKEVATKVLEIPKSDAKEEEKELYSEEEEDEDEDIEEKNELPKKQPVKTQDIEESEPEPEPEEVSDVEIIYDETVEEEEIPEEEIEEEEEISDVDDTELLSRLEAKYGRLPEPERPGQYKGGGNSLEDEWPGEPSDPYWRSQLDTAEEEFRQGRWSSAAGRAGGAGLAGSGRARWLRARALDAAADLARDNRALAQAIAAYLHLLKMNEALSDESLLRVASRTLDRIQFRGTYLSAEPVYRLLIRRFPDDVDFRNNLTVTYLMANRADLADEVLRETLLLWPNDRVALAHRGFVLKIHYNELEKAVEALRKALEGDAGRANEPRFYYHLGDALLMLGRFDEAHEVHKRGAELGHFLSPSQRSLYNVPRLRGRPWWRVEDTPYVSLARALEESWRDILKEGEAAVALYEQEKEGLKERGEWSQLDIFVRGREVGGRCARAPAVCAALRGAGAGAGAGAGCRRGQVKFSLMTPGTHVRPHVGPTNCRLRMHLALSNTEGTYIRVDKEIRQWQLGKTLLFDDSFEHEVWHNGTGSRLVLIVDVWHPDLSAAERRQLPAI